MVDTFLRLRPYGDGYSVVETGRTDSPMFFTHYVVGSQVSAAHFDTEVSTTNYVAFLVGMSFNNNGTVFQAAYMDGSGATWFITWDVAESLGSSAFFDVLFVSRGLCAEVVEP